MKKADLALALILFLMAQIAAYLAGYIIVATEIKFLVGLVLVDLGVVVGVCLDIAWTLVLPHFKEWWNERV